MSVGRGRIFQPVPGRALQKLLWGRLRIPRRVVQPTLRAAKMALGPRQVRKRRELAESARQGLSSEARIPVSAGYRLLASDEFPGTRRVVALCREIAAEPRSRTDRDALLYNRRKDFLLSILSGSQFFDHPELIRFLIARPLLDIVTDYLGAVPLLAGASLLWSPPNQTAQSSQLFHFDSETTTQLKLFLHVSDVDENHGPLTFLPADASARVAATLGYEDGRLIDEEVERAGGRGCTVTATGVAGSGVLLDTSRCLHFGSRRNRGDRLVLMAQYFLFETPSDAKLPLAVPEGLLDPPLDPVQRLALGLRAM